MHLARFAALSAAHTLASRFVRAIAISRAPSLHGHCSASSLLWAPPTPSRLPPTSRCRRLYGFPAPPLSRRDEEGLSSCLACPGHRAVALTPPEWPAASVSLRRSMLSSPYGSELDLWCFRLSRPNLRLLSLRPDDLLTIQEMALSIGFRNSVSLLSAIQATRLLTFASVGLSPTEHSSLSWTHSRTVSFPQYGFKAGLSDGAFPSTASSSRRAVCLRPSCTSLSSVVSSL